MQHFSRKWLRGWTGMALFAMLAVLSSPALAFACCCAPQTASLPASPTPVPIPVASSPALPASHPGCQGHGETGGAKTQNVTDSRVSASTVSVATPIAPPASAQPCFKSLCECGHAQEGALSFVAEQNGTSFSPLVLGVAAQRFSPALTSPSSVRFAFASNVARPRGPDLASRSGRAPPALSLRA